MAVRCPPYVPPRCCCGRMVILRSLVTTGAIFLYGLQEAHGQDVADDGGITCPEIFQTPGLCLSDNNELQGGNKLTCTAGDIVVRSAFHWTTQRPLPTVHMQMVALFTACPCVFCFRTNRINIEPFPLLIPCPRVPHSPLRLSPLSVCPQKAEPNEAKVEVQEIITGCTGP